MARQTTPGGTTIPEPPEGYRYATTTEALNKGMMVLRITVETILEGLDAGLCGEATVEELARIGKLREIHLELHDL